MPFASDTTEHPTHITLTPIVIPLKAYVLLTHGAKPSPLPASDVTTAEETADSYSHSGSFRHGIADCHHITDFQAAFLHILQDRVPNPHSASSILSSGSQRSTSHGSPDASPWRVMRRLTPLLARPYPGHSLKRTSTRTRCRNLSPQLQWHTPLPPLMP